MDKVTIQEIADEAGLSIYDLINQAKELGFTVKAANSTISFDDAGILVDYAISGTLPKDFKKPPIKPEVKIMKIKDPVEKIVPKIRQGITIINKEKKVKTDSIKGVLQDNREIYINGNKKHFLDLIKCRYEITDDDKFFYLKVILSPMDFLKSNERFKRAQLYQLEEQKINLQIMYDRFHEEDDKALEVYYDQIFIGYIQKIFEKENIDKTNIVNEFCFDKNKFNNIEINWDGENFIIQKKKQEIEYKLQNIINEIEYCKETSDGNYW